MRRQASLLFENQRHRKGRVAQVAAGVALPDQFATYRQPLAVPGKLEVQLLRRTDGQRSGVDGHCHLISQAYLSPSRDRGWNPDVRNRVAGRRGEVSFECKNVAEHINRKSDAEVRLAVGRLDARRVVRDSEDGGDAVRRRLRDGTVAVRSSCCEPWMAISFTT